MEKHVGSCSVSNEEYSGTSRYPVTRPLMEETMRSTLSSLEQARESPFHARSSSILSSMDSAPVRSVSIAQQRYHLLWLALLVQRHEDTRQEGVKNFHLCLNILNVQYDQSEQQDRERANLNLEQSFRQQDSVSACIQTLTRPVTRGASDFSSRGTQFARESYQRDVTDGIQSLHTEPLRCEIHCREMYNEIRVSWKTVWTYSRS